MDLRPGLLVRTVLVSRCLWRTRCVLSSYLLKCMFPRLSRDAFSMLLGLCSSKLRLVRPNLPVAALMTCSPLYRLLLGWVLATKT